MSLMRRFSLFITLITACGPLLANQWLAPLKESMLNHINTGRLPGYPMDIAVKDDKVYLLVQSKQKRRADRIYIYNMLSKGLQKQFQLENSGRTHYGAGLVINGNNLFVLNRSRSGYIQKFSTRGARLEAYRFKQKPGGKLYGLAYADNTFYFSSYRHKRSTIYSFSPTRGLKQLFQTAGKVRSLTAQGQYLYMYRTHQYRYAGNWLEVYNMRSRARNSYRFLPRHAHGLTTHRKNLLFMHQHRGGARIYAAYLHRQKKMIIGMPRARQVSATKRITNQNRNPYDLKFWFAIPFSRDFQEVKNLNITPEPAGYTEDSYGNKWAYIRSKNLKKVKIEFKVLLAQAAFTVDADSTYRPGRLPADIRSKYTRETHSFDYSSPAVKSLVRQVNTRGTFVDTLLGARELVNRKLEVVGPSGPETKASLFLNKGKGRCYAHTISYAALTRGLGIASRAIGGFKVISDNEFDSDVGVHAWNQIYFANRGWVDIDTQIDDQKSGKDTFLYFGNRLPGYVITFIGAFDQSDQKTHFAKRGWIFSYWWRSLDRRNRAKVRLGKMSAQSTVLNYYR